MQQISCGKQCDSKNGAPKIEVMASAVLKPPTHPRKQVKCLKDMSKSDHNQTPGAEQL